jgi:hypothetical protein
MIYEMQMPFLYEVLMLVNEAWIYEMQMPFLYEVLMLVNEAWIFAIVGILPPYRSLMLEIVVIHPVANSPE